MTDIFHEVEEDLRREKLNRLWARYGSAFLTVAVLVVAATAAYVFWSRYQDNQAQARSEAFTAAERLIQGESVDAGLAAFAVIADEGGEGYPALAMFRQAALLLAKADIQGALAVYDKIQTATSNPRLRALARLRAAYAVADQEEPGALKARVQEFVGDDNPWRFEARELQAYADYRARMPKEAGDAFAALAADAAAPEDMRDRAGKMAAYIRGGAAPMPAASETAPAAPTPAEADAPPAAER